MWNDLQLNQIDELFIFKILVQEHNFEHMIRFLTQIITSPETWLCCFIYFSNQILRNWEVLTHEIILVEDLIKVYQIAKTHTEFNYFLHTVDYYFLKFGMKILTLNWYEPAIWLGMELENKYLLKVIQSYAIIHQNIPVISILAHLRKD